MGTIYGTSHHASKHGDNLDIRSWIVSLKVHKFTCSLELEKDKYQTHLISNIHTHDKH